MRESESSRLLAYFACEVAFCVLVSALLSLQPPRLHPLMFGETEDRAPLIRRFLVPNRWTEFLSHKIKQGFTAYSSYCLRSDYLRPLSGDCLNSSGLSLTLIESLESLFLARLTKEFGAARQFVLESFRCNASDWINANELSGKVIGSLIGAFALSNDVGFLSKALECGEVLLGAFHGPMPHPIVDGVRATGRDYGFMSGTFLSESSGFFVEFVALSRLTGDPRFSSAVRNYLQCVLSNRGSLLHSVWDTKQCRPRGAHAGLTGYTAGFWANVARLHLLSPSRQTEALLDAFFDAVDRSDLRAPGDPAMCGLPAALEGLPLVRARGASAKLGRLCEARDSRDFAFESSRLIAQVSRNESVDLLPYVVVLNRTQCGPAQCALAADREIQENVQPSAALAQWLKFLLLANSAVPARAFVVNEYGHFIPTAKLRSR
jgi:hypothetical protein